MNNFILQKLTPIHPNVKVLARKISCFKSQDISIPQVDLSWTEDKIISTISQAAKSGGPGFFYIKNHGIAPSVFEVGYRWIYQKYGEALIV